MSAAVAIMALGMALCLLAFGAITARMVPALWRELTPRERFVLIASSVGVALMWLAVALK